MTKFGRFPSQPKPPPVDYIPYNQIEVLVGNERILARPFEWDSEPVPGSGHNDQGKPVKPTKLSTICPHCGAGVIIDATLSGSDFFVVGSDGKFMPELSVPCEQCGAGLVAAPPPLPDPFVNPITGGIIAEVELDPSLISVDKVSLAEVDRAATVEPPKLTPAKPPPKPTKSKSKAKVVGPKKQVKSATTPGPADPEAAARGASLGSVLDIGPEE